MLRIMTIVVLFLILISLTSTSLVIIQQSTESNSFKNSLGMPIAAGTTFFNMEEATTQLPEGRVGDTYIQGISCYILPRA